MLISPNPLVICKSEFTDSQPWSDLKTGSGTQSRILAHAYQLRCDLEDYYIRRVPNTTHKLVFAFLQDLAPPCAV